MLTIPLLVGIHVLAGISTAGVALCSTNIALRVAPRGEATTFLAVNALVIGIAATLAPICGGFLADFFEAREFGFFLSYGLVGQTTDPVTITALNLRGLDFLFVIAFFLGLYALHRLLAVREEGDVGERVVRQEFYLELRRIARSVSNVAGMRALSYFPYGATDKRKDASPGARGWWRMD